MISEQLSSGTARPRADTTYADGMLTGVIRTPRPDDLSRVADSTTQAVIYLPVDPAPWMSELSAFVASHHMQVPRTVIEDVDREAILHWLHEALHSSGLPSRLRGVLIEDILGLIDRTQQMTGAERFVFRALTAIPNRRCGFHVDTVSPGSSRIGLLRVYNGAGTDYVDADDLTSVRDFYNYLGRRERLVRELDLAGARGDEPGYQSRLNEIVELDTCRSFLKEGTAIHTAPSGSIVAFKHLDVRWHWSDHSRELAWIHCSPMVGERRFLVNVAPHTSSRIRPISVSTGTIAR